MVNETLRRGLAAGAKPAPAMKPFVLKAKSCGFLPGIDQLKLNQLADALDSDFDRFPGLRRRNPLAAAR